MPKTVYAAKVQDYRKRILAEPNQHRRIALLHRFLSLNRLSRIQIAFARLRVNELREELVLTDRANADLLESLEIRVEAAMKRHDNRAAKRAAERAAAQPPAPPVEEAPTESYADRIRRLIAEDAVEKEKKKVAEEKKP